VKKFVTLAALAMVAVSITATTALASPGPVDTGRQACEASGPAMVNVNYTYTSPDSGLGGNTWANDTIKRQIQIFKVDGGYCASVKDQGSFVTVEGRSPGNTDDIPAGITGTLKGGYTTTVLTLTGTSFNPDALPTRGNLGIFTHLNRPSFMSYGLSGALADWGWVYETTNNGSWVNASIPPATTETSPTSNPTPHQRARSRRPPGFLFRCGLRRRRQ
jgi:hypothetical protein